MLIYLLLLLIITITLISYILVKKDIFAPPVVFSGTFIVSIIIAIPNMSLWAFDIGIRTFMVLFMGVLSVCIGFFVIYFFKIKTTYKLENAFLNTNAILYIKNYKLIIFFLFQILTLFLFYKEFSIIAANMGGGDSLAEKIFLFRMNTASDNIEGSISTLVSNFMFINTVSVYFFSYCFWYEYLKKNSIRIKYLLLFIVPILISLLQGGRGGFVNLLLGFIIIMYILWLINNNWKKMISVKQFLIILSMLVLFLILFSSVGLLILGRDNQFEQSSSILGNIFRQISVYIAAPLKLLDMYMYTDYGTEDTVWGLSTFRSIYKFLGKIFDNNSWLVPSGFGEEMRSDNGESFGNVYTMFRPYVQDFDYIGLIVLGILVGIIVGYIYFLIKYKQNNSIININIVIYSVLLSCLIQGFFSDVFYRTIFSTYFLKFVLYFKIIEWIFLSNKINKNHFRN